MVPGPTGATGATGATGVTGATGATGSGGGASSYLSRANTSGSVIAVVLGGTNIPMPYLTVLDSGITADGSNTTFTVSQAGLYRVTYRIVTTSSYLAASRITVNGSGYIPLDFTPTTSVNTWAGDAIVTLSAGDVLTVQLYGMLGAVTLQSGAGGANIQIVRLN